MLQHVPCLNLLTGLETESTAFQEQGLSLCPTGCQELMLSWLNTGFLVLGNWRNEKFQLEMTVVDLVLMKGTHAKNLALPLKA